MVYDPYKQVRVISRNAENGPMLLFTQQDNNTYHKKETKKNIQALKESIGVLVNFIKTVFR